MVIEGGSVLQDYICWQILRSIRRQLVREGAEVHGLTVLCDTGADVNV